jgi:hypothetical protein
VLRRIKYSEYYASHSQSHGQDSWICYSETPNIYTETRTMIKIASKRYSQERKGEFEVVSCSFESYFELPRVLVHQISSMDRDESTETG